MVFISNALSQQYFSKTYFFNEHNVAIGNMLHNEDIFFISTNTFFGIKEVAGVLKLDEGGNELKSFVFPWFDSGRNSMSIHDAGFYITGHSIVNGKEDISITKFDWNLDSIWHSTYELNGFRHLNLNSLVINNELFVQNYDLFFEEITGHLETNLLRISEDGETISSKNFGQNLGGYAPNTMINTMDENLLLSSRKWNVPGSICNKGVLLKASLDGDTIWTTDLNCSDWPGDTVDVIECSDSSIISSYVYDYSDDNNWTNFPYVPNLYFLSKDGLILNDTSFVTDEFIEPQILGLYDGKEDYFFAVGHHWHWVSHWENERGLHAWLFKMNYDGELIWERRISNADTPLGSHYLTNLIELENGDLFLSGQISNNDQSLAWIVKTNSEGCTNEMDCQEEQILSSTIDVLNKKLEFEVFPNPTSSQITLKAKDHNCVAVIYNSNGQRILDIKFDKQVKVSLQGQPSGIYTVVINDSHGNYGIQRFIKQ